MKKVQALLQTTWVRRFVNRIPDVVEVVVWMVATVIILGCVAFFIAFFCLMLLILGALV